MKTAYRFKLRPTPTQERELVKMAGARRWVYNWALNQSKTYYKEHKKSKKWSELSSELTKLKTCEETRWLKEADSQILQQSLVDLKSAYTNFFEKRAKFPRFKKKSGKQSFRFPQRVKVVGNKVFLPKIGFVRAFISRDMKDVITKSATIIRDSLGHWYVSLVVVLDFPVLNQGIEPSVGLDLGLSSFVTTNEGEKTDNPRFFKQAERKLARRCRRFSRCKLGSKRREKAKLKVAQTYKKVTNRRKDFLHKLANSFLRRFNFIAMENLSAKGLVKTKLAKSILDASWTAFRSILRYKSSWQGKTVVLIDRFFPSSKMCSSCGALTELTLKQREWECGCGVKHDRDVNAAKNILCEGLRMYKTSLGLESAGQSDLNSRSSNKSLHSKA